MVNNSIDDICDRDVVKSGTARIRTEPVGSAALTPGDIVYFDGTDWEKADLALDLIHKKFGVVGFRSRINTTTGAAKVITDTYGTSDNFPLILGPATAEGIILGIHVDIQGSSAVPKYSRWTIVDTDRSGCSTTGCLMNITHSMDVESQDKYPMLPLTNIDQVGASDTYALILWGGGL